MLAGAHSVPAGSVHNHYFSYFLLIVFCKFLYFHKTVLKTSAFSLWALSTEFMKWLVTFSCRCTTITLMDADVLSIQVYRKNFCEIWIKQNQYDFHLKDVSDKRWPCYLSFNVLIFFWSALETCLSTVQCQAAREGTHQWFCPNGRSTFCDEDIRDEYEACKENANLNCR